MTRPSGLPPVLCFRIEAALVYGVVWGIAFLGVFIIGGFETLGGRASDPGSALVVSIAAYLSALWTLMIPGVPGLAPAAIHPKRQHWYRPWVFVVLSVAQAVLGYSLWLWGWRGHS